MPKGISKSGINKGYFKKGYIRSEESKQRQSKSNKGRIITSETRKKISLANLGKNHTKEAKRKMSETITRLFAKGELVSPMKGKHHTEESKEKNRIAHLGKITWRKGLTKETDERIKNSAENTSNTRKKLFAEGKLDLLRKGKTYKEIYKNDYSKVGFQKGELNPMKNKEISRKVALSMKGRKMLDTTKAKLREIRKTQIFPIKDTKIEIKIQNFLKLLNIEFYTHYYTKEIPHAYQCDILIPQSKTIIECDGDYWHANPARFSIPNAIQLEQIKEDKIRTKELQEKGFRVIRLWESEINKLNLDKFKETIFNYN